MMNMNPKIYLAYHEMVLDSLKYNVNPLKNFYLWLNSKIPEGLSSPLFRDCCSEEKSGPLTIFNFSKT